MYNLQRSVKVGYQLTLLYNANIDLARSLCAIIFFIQRLDVTVI